MNVAHHRECFIADYDEKHLRSLHKFNILFLFSLHNKVCAVFTKPQTVPGIDKAERNALFRAAFRPSAV